MSEAENPYRIQYDGEERERKYIFKDGKAKSTFPNEDTYEGEYKSLLRNGQGVYTFNCLAEKYHQPAVYSGEYKDGQRCGIGTMTYPDGSRYTGQWLNGKRHGEGAYTYVNGDVYAGEWNEDAREGRGEYRLNDGSESMCRGVWKQGNLRSGKWMYCDRDGKQFEAEINEKGRVTRYLTSKAH